MSILDNLDWGSWLYGLIAATIGGGASAVTAGITVAAIDPKDFAIGGGHFMVLVATVFMTQGTLSFFLYLKQSPLPAVKTVTTVQTVEQPDKPTKTISTVQETKITPPDKP